MIFYILMIVVFILGYTAIALEHPIKIDKAGSALVTGTLCWAIYALAPSDVMHFNDDDAITISQSSESPTQFKEFLEDEVIANSISNKYKDKQDLVANGEIVAPITPIEKEKTEELSHSFITEKISEHLGDISMILFFLLCAMTIVEVIDVHEGFRLITDKITTTNRVKLLWIMSIMTFFFSAALDNLTTAIVMSTLLKKLMKDKKDLWFFAAMVILAANAGGAWSPIGDVTTIMLWIGGQITALNIVFELFIPSLVCVVVPLIIVSITMKGEVDRPLGMLEKENLLNPTTLWERNFVFFLGVGALLFVPVFKTLTHLPPVLGMAFGLGVLWIVTEIMHRSKSQEVKSRTTVIGALKKVDTTSVLFFLGILLAVAALQSAGQLADLSTMLNEKIGNIYAIDLIIGVLSSVIDNVPLVAGAIGMYDITPLSHFAVNGEFWEFLAYCAGTGGSILIIGSAAGVAVMGILKIDFIWYLKKISLLALAGYIAGAATFYFIGQFL